MTAEKPCGFAMIFLSSRDRSLARFKSAPRTSRTNAHIGPRMEKTVNLYDARWKPTFSWSRLVARPTCIAVSTKAMETVAVAIQTRLSRKKLLQLCQPRRYESKGDMMVKR